MNEIPKYSLIYYIDDHKFQFGFSASSRPMFEITIEGNRIYMS